MEHPQNNPLNHRWFSHMNPQITDMFQWFSYTFSHEHPKLFHCVKRFPHHLWPMGDPFSKAQEPGASAAPGRVEAARTGQGFWSPENDKALIPNQLGKLEIWGLKHVLNIWNLTSWRIVRASGGWNMLNWPKTNPQGTSCKGTKWKIHGKVAKPWTCGDRQCVLWTNTLAWKIKPLSTKSLCKEQSPTKTIQVFSILLTY